MFNKGYRERAIERLKEKEKEYKEINDSMLSKASGLYDVRKEFKKVVDRSWNYLNSLRNKPEYLDIRLKEINLETSRFKKLEEVIKKEAESVDLKSKSGVAASVAGGAAAAALGPTAAMKIAMTFGTASTGTAISTLSGAAATNAALAWLGGGALVAKGGGMALGGKVLTLFGPAGWIIGGIGLTTAGIFSNSKNKEIAQKANKHSAELETHIKSNKGLIEEMSFIEKEIKETSNLLNTYLIVCSKMTLDFNSMSRDDRHDLSALINNTYSGAKLLNKGIGENK